MKPLLHSLLASAIVLGVVTADCAEQQQAKQTSAVLSEDFENGRAQWRPEGVGSLDTERSHDGQTSLKLVDDDDEKYFTTDCRLPVRPDSVYDLSFWTFGADARNATLCVIQLEEKGKQATFEGQRLVRHYFPFSLGAIPGRWSQIRRRFTTGPATIECVLRLNPADGSPKHSGAVWFDDISLEYVGPGKLVLRTTPKLPDVPRAPAAEESLPLKPLPALELDLASPDCAILCPAQPELREAGRKLADAIEARADHRPSIVDDTADPATLGRGPLLVMGNLMLSAAGRKLYLTGYDFTDYAWPGAGGHVIRTIRDPFATGAHVLMIGGSTPADVVAATLAAAELIKRKGPQLTYLNEVKLGENADLIEGWTEEFKRNDPKTWDRIGPLGSWTYMEQIGKAGMGFLRTGDQAYLEPFRRELLLFFEHDVINRKHEAPSQIHSLIDALLMPWDLLADHPFFAPEERREIDEKFLYLACSHEGARPLRGAGWKLRSNHGLGRALDVYWLGRYFWRRYGIEEGKEWMALADNYFAPQMAASKTTEDNSYHQFAASLCCTLMYALAAGREDYLTSRPLREAAERAILWHSVGSGPLTYLSACAVAANDPRYLSLVAHLGSEGCLKHCAAMKGASILGENLRSFCGFATPGTRDDLIGVSAALLDPMWHEAMASWTDGGQYIVTTRPEESFDKLAIRDGFQPEDFHLVVDGLCGGGHSFQDSNCITKYKDRGLVWLREQYGYSGPTCSTVRQQNGVFIALNGQGPGAVHRCARLLYARKLPDGYDAVGGALEGIGDVAWQRHILRKRGAWTLVIDRAIANRQGEMLVERLWHVRGKVTSTPDGIISEQGDCHFHLQSAGLDPSGISGAANRKEVVRANLKPGAHIELAALIWVSDESADKRYDLAQTAQGWRVSEGEDAVGIAVAEDGLRLSPTAGEPVSPPETLPLKPPAEAIKLPWRRVELGEPITTVATGADCVAAGTQGGTVIVVALDGDERWKAKVESQVLSPHFLDRDLLVGEDNGTISRFDPLGKRLWSVTIPYVSISWPHWSDKRSRIHEITSADLDGDGEQEILLSNGDRRVYAFSGAGEQLWKRGVRWGIYNAMTPTTYLGKFALFGGARGPTLRGRLIIYGANGEPIGHLDAPSMASQQVRDVRLVDLTGDGAKEIICARDINSNQLIVCNEERAPIWQGEVGGSPNALAIRDHEGERHVLCASECGYLHAFGGADGERRWFCYLGEDARFLWPRRDGSVLAACPSGGVFVVSPEGELLARDDLGAPITALLRPGEHRVSPSAIPIGTEDGALHILQLPKA